MGAVKTAWYRSFQAVFNVGARCLNWRRPIPFSGVGSIQKIPGLLKTEKAKAFIDEIRAMNKRMGIPTGFDCIREQDIPQMIDWALAESNPVYPVPVVYDKKRCEKVIRRIMA